MNKKYFKNSKSSGSVASYNRSQLNNFMHRLNGKYNGSRTPEIHERMGYGQKSISGWLPIKLNMRFDEMIIELKSIMYGMS